MPDPFPPRRRRVALFARWPVPGRVKTRLSPALPPREACVLYGAMLEDAIAAVVASAADEWFLYWAEPPGDATAAARFARGLVQRPQRGADLGARLVHAFGELLSQPGDRAAIVGADCPLLGAAEIDRAFEALESADVALGPTPDGGYYLVGLARPAPALFEGVDWSSAFVLGQTLERARDAGLGVARLDTLEDMDEPGDVVRLLERAVRSPALAELRTLAALRELGLAPEPGA